MRERGFESKVMARAPTEHHCTWLSSRTIPRSRNIALMHTIATEDYQTSMEILSTGPQRASDLQYAGDQGRQCASVCCASDQDLAAGAPADTTLRIELAEQRGMENEIPVAVTHQRDDDRDRSNDLGRTYGTPT